jgi:hypothetical protein
MDAVVLNELEFLQDQWQMFPLIMLLVSYLLQLCFQKTKRVMRWWGHSSVVLPSTGGRASFKRHRPIVAMISSDDDHASFI